MNFEVEREPRVGRENGGDKSAELGMREPEYDIILMLLQNSSVFRPVPRPSLYRALLSALQNMSLHFGYHSVSHLDMSFLSSLPPAHSFVLDRQLHVQQFSRLSRAAYHISGLIHQKTHPG